MTIPVFNGPNPLVTPTPSPTPAATPPLTPAQRGDVDTGRAAVVEGQVVPIGRGGVNATAAHAASWNRAPEGSPQRLAFDQTAQRLGTTDPTRVASDISRQLGAGSTPPGQARPDSPGNGPPGNSTPSNGPPGNSTPNSVSSAPAAGIPNPLSGGSNPPPTGVLPGGPANSSGLLGGVANLVNGVGGTARGLLNGNGPDGNGPPGLLGSRGPGVPGSATGVGSSSAGNPLTSPLAALGNRAVPAAAGPVAATLSTVSGAVGTVGAVAQTVTGALPVAPGTAAPAIVTITRDATGPFTLARGEGALGGATLEAGLQTPGGLTLDARGLLAAGLLPGALPLAAQPRGVEGGIAPSAGRALAQEALLARMANMFAPTGQGARGGEPGSWMGLAAALAAARGVTAEAAAAALARPAGDAVADGSHLATRQPDGAPAFGANPALRADDHPDEATAAALGGGDAPFTCRADSRPPEIIFAGGFEANAALGDVVAVAGDAALPPAAPLANAAALDIARLGQHRSATTLRRIGGVDVDRTGDALGDGFAQEIAAGVAAAAPRTVRALNLGDGA